MTHPDSLRLGISLEKKDIARQGSRKACFLLHISQGQFLFSSPIIIKPLALNSHSIWFQSLMAHIGVASASPELLKAGPRQV